MSRKHYVEIAGILRGEFEAATSPKTRGAIRRMAGAIADMAKLDNPAFDRGRFLDACGFGVKR